jgi:hypothetical protein
MTTIGIIVKFSKKERGIDVLIFRMILAFSLFEFVNKLKRRLSGRKDGAFLDDSIPGWGRGLGNPLFAFSEAVSREEKQAGQDHDKAGQRSGIDCFMQEDHSPNHAKSGNKKGDVQGLGRPHFGK